MDILYIVGNCSKCEDMELRCSLRSIERHGINVDRVFVVGYCPEWLSDKVIKIPCEIDYSKPKNKNIYRQLLYAIDNSDIGVNNDGEFLISMDDHFYCDDVDFDNYPFYMKDYQGRFYRYLLPNMLDYTKSSIHYQKILVNTYHFCLNNKLPIFNFTIHRNMHCNRYIIKEMEHLNDLIISDDTPEVEGLAIMLNYRMRYYPFKYEITIDEKSDKISKINKWRMKHHVFSLEDFNMDSTLYNYLRLNYNSKSKYEK